MNPVPYQDDDDDAPGPTGWEWLRTFAENPLGPYLAANSRAAIAGLNQCLVRLREQHDQLREWKTRRDEYLRDAAAAVESGGRHRGLARPGEEQRPGFQLRPCFDPPCDVYLWVPLELCGDGPKIDWPLPLSAIRNLSDAARWAVLVVAHDRACDAADRIGPAADSVMHEVLLSDARSHLLHGYQQELLHALLLRGREAAESTHARKGSPIDPSRSDIPDWIPEHFYRGKQFALLRELWNKGRVPALELTKALGYLDPETRLANLHRRVTEVNSKLNMMALRIGTTWEIKRRTIENVLYYELREMDLATAVTGRQK